MYPHDILALLSFHPPPLLLQTVPCPGPLPTPAAGRQSLPPRLRHPDAAAGPPLAGHDGQSADDVRPGPADREPGAGDGGLQSAGRRGGG